MAVEGRRTWTKNRVFAGSQMLARFDEGTVDDLAPDTEEQIVRNLPALYRSAEAVIISDYSCGTADAAGSSEAVGQAAAI